AIRDISHQLASLRVILLSASFLGMLACAPLWLNSREYPLIPVAAWFPTLMEPWDKYFFGGLLGSLVLALWFYRSAVLFFLSGSLFLVLGDQNRAQPWFYMYWIMLCLSLVPEPSSLAACRCALSAVYVWGGLQKCQPGFYKLV